MSVEEIYDELYAIAGHVGPLDEDAVQSATRILALPRYAASPPRAALLVDDLKHVISEIPADTWPEKPEGDPWASRYFRSYARRFFSLDASGEMLSHRRSFGRKDPGGTAGTWMNRGVVYRVAAGLLELWSETGNLQEWQDEARIEQGYRINAIRATRHLEKSKSFPSRDVFEYKLHLLTTGPHLLMLPFPYRYTALALSHNTMHLTGQPQPQLISVERDSQQVAAAIFGLDAQPEQRVSLQVEHRPRITGRCPDLTSCGYEVNQPVGSLTLAVASWEIHKEEREWRLLAIDSKDPRDATTLDEPSAPYVSISQPEVGTWYQLDGFRIRSADSSRA
jgi:hypothetical protein